MKTALVEGPEPQTLALNAGSSVDRALLFGNSPNNCKEKKSSVKSSFMLRTQYENEESCNEELDWTTEFPYTHPAGFEDEERHSYLKSVDLSQLVRKHSRQSRIDDYIEKYEFIPGSYGTLAGANVNEDENNLEDLSKNTRNKKKSSLGKSLSNSNTRRRKKKSLKNSFDTIFSPIYTFFQKPKTPTTPARDHEKEPVVSSTEVEEHEKEIISTSVPMDLDEPKELEEADNMNAENIHSSDLDQDHSETPFVLEDMEPYEFIAALPDANDICNFPSLCVPSKNPDDPQITLVLDLDETLVHCSTEPCQNADLVFPVYFGGTEYLVYARKRPYLDYFLHEIRKCFEVIVFTASQQAYADTILNLLDPEGYFFKHRAFRDSCVFIEGNFLKDLRVLGRELSKCVILDNSPQAFGLQVENGIPITTWIDDSEDRELLNLLPFLKQIAVCEDVRPFLSRRFHLADLVARYRKLMYLESSDRFHLGDEKDMFVTVT